MLFKNYFNATRIWTLNFVFAANLINLALLYKNGIDIDVRMFLCTLFIEILVNNISNLVNSYYDYINGLDVESTSGDRTMFSYSLKLNQLKSYTKYTFIFVIFISFYLVYLINNNNNISNNNNSCNHNNHNKIVFIILSIFLNSLLAFYYTAPPFELKYNCLGEVSASIGYFFLGSFSYYVQSNCSEKELNQVFHYAMIFTLGCLSIIYSNNVRDIKVDKKANIKTIPIYFGEKISYVLYFIIYLTIYLYCIFISIKFNNRLLVLPLITIYDLNKIYHKSKIFSFDIDIDKLSALMVLKLSFLLSFGIVCDQFLTSQIIINK